MPRDRSPHRRALAHYAVQHGMATAAGRQRHLQPRKQGASIRALFSIAHAARHLDEDSDLLTRIDRFDVLAPGRQPVNFVRPAALSRRA